MVGGWGVSLKAHTHMFKQKLRQKTSATSKTLSHFDFRDIKWRCIAISRALIVLNSSELRFL